MNNKSGWVKFFWVILSFMLLILVNSITPAQAETNAVSQANACMGNCLIDQTILHSALGNTAAKNSYLAWYDTYYELTGCNDNQWKNDLIFLLDIISDMVGAPGAPTLQCWQGLMAQASLCGDACAEYFIPNGKYSPNINLDLEGGLQGSFSINIDNFSNGNKAPEYQPNAYSRIFPLEIFWQYEDYPEIKIGELEIESLSFPNWITSGGYEDCITAYGASDHRCKILESFEKEDEILIEESFGDGRLYDLSNFITDSQGMSGSFSTGGFVQIKSDENFVEIEQGDYAGLKLIETKYLSDNHTTYQIETWDAQNGAVTITNEECNCAWYNPFCTCRYTEERRNTDTTILAWHGPANKALNGEYRIRAVANIAHDKDTTDNEVSYTYQSAQNLPPDQITPTPPANPSLLTPITISAGVHDGGISPGTSGILYKLQVPDGLRLVEIKIEATENQSVLLFLNKDSYPVPSYPIIHSWEYDCWDDATPEYEGYCMLHQPLSGDYYIFIAPGITTASYRMTIQFIENSTATSQSTNFMTDTPPTTETNSGTVTKTPNVEETAPPNDEDTSTWEIENNNTYQAATDWNFLGRYYGKIAQSGDLDYVKLTIPATGIYTLYLSDVADQIAINLRLLNQYRVDKIHKTDAQIGEDIVIQFDAHAGETFYLQIFADRSNQTSDQPYLLQGSWIPDEGEPDDAYTQARVWNDLTTAMEGYFFEVIHGTADYYQIITPDFPNTFQMTVRLDQVPENINAHLSILNQFRVKIAENQSSQQKTGQPVSITFEANPNENYYLRINQFGNRKYSIEPYTISIQWNEERK